MIDAAVETLPLSDYAITVGCLATNLAIDANERETGYYYRPVSPGPETKCDTFVQMHAACPPHVQPYHASVSGLATWTGPMDAERLGRAFYPGAACLHCYTHIRRRSHKLLRSQLSRERRARRPPAQLSIASSHPSPPRRRSPALRITPAGCSRGTANKFVGRKITMVIFLPTFSPGAAWGCTGAGVALRGRH